MISEAQPIQPTMQTIEQTIGRLMSVAKTDAVFGQPIQRDGTTIIPCSEISLGMGWGSGSAQPSPGAQPKQQAGTGGGVGGGLRERPVAVIVMTSDSVRVQPIPNVNRIVASVFSAIGFAFLWQLRRRQQIRAAMFLRQIARARMGRRARRQMWWQMLQGQPQRGRKR
jgi:uncharacterized spore protein YtfJ